MSKKIKAALLAITIVILSSSFAQATPRIKVIKLSVTEPYR